MTDRDRLIELIEKWHENPETFQYLADYLLANDVVKVVRCKDCKHYIPKENLTDEYDNSIGADGLCDNTDTYTDETDFCSYGELKELKDNGNKL